MIIKRAIVATSPTPLYYEFWPLVARGWRNINIEPVVAAIGNLNLNYAEGTVIKFPLIKGIDPGFIAQVIRFIIPCFFPDEVSVIADIDMVPLSVHYFSENISQYDDDKVIIFSSDAYPGELRYPMCYIAAKGKYFQQIIGLKSLDLRSITTFIEDLHALNLKWDTDELFFARKLHESPLFNKTVFLKRGWHGIADRRIDRGSWKHNKLGFIFNQYVDAHCVRPFNSHQKELKDIIEYVGHGSSGKAYCFYLLKRPIRSFINFFKLIGQNFAGKGLFAINEVKNINKAKSNIISFSLYGNSARYIQNLQQVIGSYKKLLPDWKCRVYAAKDVSNSALQLLIGAGCEVFIMHGAGIDARYMLWRFLAIEDKNAGAAIIRDLDSICSEREQIMINQWLSSNKTFHIIRDHVNHNTAIMGGMWGAKRNGISIKDASKKMLLTNNYGMDQVFLQKMIYPLIKDDVIVHDSMPRFPVEDAIVIPFDDSDGFVGEIYTDEASKQRDKTIIEGHYKKCFSIE